MKIALSQTDAAGGSSEKQKQMPNSNEPLQTSSSRGATGLFEIRADYASSQKQLVFDLYGFTQAENPKKVQGST